MKVGQGEEYLRVEEKEGERNSLYFAFSQPGGDVQIKCDKSVLTVERMLLEVLKVLVCRCFGSILC